MHISKTISMVNVNLNLNNFHNFHNFHSRGTISVEFLDSRIFHILTLLGCGDGADTGNQLDEAVNCSLKSPSNVR